MPINSVRILRSRKRRRTVSARLVKDILVVRAPEHMPEDHLERAIVRLRSRIERRNLKDGLNRDQALIRRAVDLNARFFDNRLKINSIEYVTGQTSKFGCCNCRTGQIRISHRVGAMPDWVRDYVIIHELAHLVVPSHSRDFWEIVNRYRFAERARGYLIAFAAQERT